MSLFADPIRLGEPGDDFAIDLFQAFEPEGVKVVPRRKSFDPAKARMFEAPRENDVAVDPVSPNHKRREAHSDLESDPRFLRKHGDRPVLSGDREQFVEDRADFGRLALEMRRERGPAAGVRLITVREPPPAIRAAPQRWIGRSAGRC